MAGYPNRYFRRLNLTRDKLNGVVFDPGKLDTELNDIAQVLQQVNDFIRAGYNANKTLKPTTPPTAQDLLSLTRFAATAAQEDYTVPEYDIAEDVVLVWVDGSLIDSALVTLTDATTVTYAPTTPLVGTEIVQIAVFTSGSGTLTRLADSDTVDEGASLVGLRDVAGLYEATDVEAALAEVMDAVNDLDTEIGTVGEYIQRDGSVDFTGDQDMGGNSITGLRASVTAGEAVRHEQLQAVISQLGGVTSSFLAKTGGTMSGIIDHGGFRATSVGTPTATTDAANKAYVDSQLLSFGGLPVGAVTDYAGTSIPSGWLTADGSAVSRTTYANLFAAIGVAHGAGDGTTTFNLPDLQGRVTIGVGSGSGLTARSLGDEGGFETHTLDISEMPSHSHSFTLQAGTGVGSGAGFGNSTASAGLTGGGLPHNNMQPFTALKKIIKY